MYGEKKNKRKQLNNLGWKILIMTTVIILFVPLVFLPKIYSYFALGKNLSGNSMKTGTLLIQAETQSIDMDNEDTQIPLKITNIGTLPLQLDIQPQIQNTDCRYFLANGYTIQEAISHKIILDPSQSITYNYDISLTSEPILTDLNCAVKIHILAWQTNFTTPSKGFTQSTNLNINITKSFILSPL